MKYKVKTNNVPRPILYGCDLTEKELEDFDYYTGQELLNQRFLRYKGWVYDMGDFLSVTTLRDPDQPLKDWEGYFEETYCSGIVIRHPFDPTCGRNGSYDYDHIIVGSFSGL